jgi:hypothetical protein
MKECRDVLKEYGLYEHNVTFIKQMGDIVKIVNVVACRKPGLEDSKKAERGSVNDSKVESSIARSKSAVQEYALCNDWDWFVTLTIDKEKYDRYNLKEYYKDLSRFLLNYNRYCKEEEKVKYLFIPELHKDGAWHIHGLLKGIKEKDLITNENGYLSWKQYQEKFGFISIGSIKDKRRVSSYIQKYINKDMGKDNKELNNHLYYCSKGLKKAELLYKGSDVVLLCDWDYESQDGYCRVKMLDSSIMDYKNFIRIIE